MSTFNFQNCFKLLFISIVVVLSTNSCLPGDDGPAGCSIRWALELGDELALASSTAIAYEQNDTEANCIAYRNALQAYLDELRPYGNCQALTGSDRDGYEDSMDDLQESIDELNCSE